MTVSARLRDLADKATPGPWRYEVEGGDEWWFGNGNQAVIRSSAEGQDRWDSVAVLGCHRQATEVPDARLIALAPELARWAADAADALSTLDEAAQSKFGEVILDAEGSEALGLPALLARLSEIAGADE